jgi:hypothetical protein
MEEWELPERLRGLDIKKFIPDGEKVVVVLSDSQIEAFISLTETVMNAKERGA